jgi:hypothetical protein
MFSRFWRYSKFALPMSLLAQALCKRSTTYRPLNASFLSLRSIWAHSSVLSKRKEHTITSGCAKCAVLHISRYHIEDNRHDVIPSECTPLDVGLAAQPCSRFTLKTQLGSHDSAYLPVADGQLHYTWPSATVPCNQSCVGGK